MNDAIEGSDVNAWIAIDHAGEAQANPYLAFPLEPGAARNPFAAIEEGDWILVVTPQGHFIRTGCVLRLRTELEKTTAYFDRLLVADEPIPIQQAGLSMPENNRLGRLHWNRFIAALAKLAGKTVEEIPIIGQRSGKETEDATYIRELLQLSVMDDLLGPANGPFEQIVGVSVRDRYLVGKLAPMDVGGDGTRGWEGVAATEAEDTSPTDLSVHEGRYDPGVELDGAAAKAEAQGEIHATNNRSLIPSSFGMTFCIDGDAPAIEVEARWGRYQRIRDAKPLKPRTNPDAEAQAPESPPKAWQRTPHGGTIKINLRPGRVRQIVPDPTQPQVCIQGTVRDQDANGDRLVTLFLVNTQKEPERNKDRAWIFQPELIVRAARTAANAAVFRRKPASQAHADDPERGTLDMIYRRQVEFAVGHGVAVHAETAPGQAERAMEVRTVVMPQHEVPVTETPGLRPEDRPAMRDMAEQGYLDMRELATMERPHLTRALSILTDDYQAWIAEQLDRIGSEVVGFDEHARTVLDQCAEIHSRLEEAVQLLADEKNEAVLKAFRFANAVMAQQRIHSLYALARRRGRDVELAQFDKRENRSWRPFQIAFVLLSLPALADPKHADRAAPMGAIADLLWFPTGGGKTEAYLGVAAFAMAMRRLQGELGGYDGSRGLTVIMRYTLRLLTLQQFQRATTLICAMEAARRQAIAAGDDGLGHEPFTIGLWVGNRVSPGTTADSLAAIQNIRSTGRSGFGRVSPGQLTSCPWCGSEISDERNIEVNAATLRTNIFCGDDKGHCAFSKQQSIGQPHPGLPVLVVDEEIYHRPPTMMIATVDKFAMMARRGAVRTLFGCVTTECPRHGLLWPEANCTGNHQKQGDLPATAVRTINPIRPPDLIIQDEFHLISGPLGTMVGLYETAVDELCSWRQGDQTVRPKIVASTATVRKAGEQVHNVFMRRVSIFPPSGLDVADNFFSVQRPIEQIPGRRYLGVCAPGSSRPAMLIRVYTAFLTAAQALFERFGQAADPYLTTIGYFNSLRELGGMKRLAEDDVQTRCFRVQMGHVDRPGLAQRSVRYVEELTSRVSNRQIPKYLDRLEVKFKAERDDESGKFTTQWNPGELRSIDLLLATNMISVGIDVNRLGLMVVNGQPKATAEYIQATSRIGRAFPGLVCSVLTWARPRDLSHYETFEYYHATFYKHVEAQSATPFSPRAMDRGLTGAMLSILRLKNDSLNPNAGADALNNIDRDRVMQAVNAVVRRAWETSDSGAVRDRAANELQERLDQWAAEAGKGGRKLAYEKWGKQEPAVVPLLHNPGMREWGNFTVPMSMREVEPDVRLMMNATTFAAQEPSWTSPSGDDDKDEGRAENKDENKDEHKNKKEQAP